LSLEDARRLVEGYVEHYNNVRLNSAIGYSRRRMCWRGVSRKSTQNATANWKPPDSNARVTDSKPREHQVASRRDIGHLVKWMVSGLPTISHNAHPA
jgi:hypothetical protein